MVSIASDRLGNQLAACDIKGIEALEHKRELRVLQVFSVLSMGGAETWLLSLLKYFQEQREELPVKVKFDVLLTGGTKALFDDEATALGARLFYVPFTRRNLVGFAREFRRILANGNYDAIHDHQDYIAGLHFLMGAGHLPPKRIAHVHNPLYHRNNYANDFGRRTAKSAGKYLLGRFATHVMGTSRQIVTEYGFDDLAAGDVVLGLAHCGFDVNQYQGDYKKAHASVCREFGWPETSKLILFIGRLEADEVVHLGRTMTHKNPAFALDVARECIARDEKVRLVMVGAGDAKRREFEDEVRGWGLEKEIRFAGVRQDVPRLMLGSDLLLFPSLAEGLGMVVVEAQAAGLRVLASDTTPRECVVIPELVDFVSLDASPDQWADRAMDLMSLVRLDTNECGATVRQSAFSIESSAARLLHLYSGK